MTRIKAALFAVFLLGAAGPAAAQQDEPSLLFGGAAVPNFLGTTGLLLTPSAYTVGDRGLAGHVHGSGSFYSFGGLIGPMDRLEVGLTYAHADGGFLGDEDGVLLNLKFQLLKENVALPAVSVGVTDTFDSLDLDPSWYLVASKDISQMIPFIPVRVHLGYGGGLYDDEVFAGGEVRLGLVNGIAEYANGDVNLGLRLRVQGFAATLALFDFDRIGGGISYTTGIRLW
jgi:hypothetical protein